MANNKQETIKIVINLIIILCNKLNKGAHLLVRWIIIISGLTYLFKFGFEFNGIILIMILSGDILHTFLPKDRRYIYD